MKTSEIAAVARAEDGGLVVTTHDGQTVYAEAGEVRPWDGPAPIRFPVESAEAAAPAMVIDDSQPDPEPDPVPDGTVAEVLAWVDGNSGRAVRAWEAEAAKEKPRASLVAELEKLAQG